MPFDNLLDAFEAWANFGTGSINALNSMTSTSMMDGARWAKFCKEAGLVDGKVVTVTEVDIVFNKVRPPNQRKVDYEGFMRGLEFISEKRFPSVKTQPERMKMIISEVLESSGPLAKTNVAPTTEATTSVVNRLTDVTGYTGTHKERFNTDGTGRGRDGRDTTAGLGKASNRTYKGIVQDVVPPTGKRAITQSMEQVYGMEGLAPLAKKGDVRSSTEKMAGSKGSLKGGNVFDRLTNSNAYTGTHKERFNADGTGRGMGGRDSIAKGAGTQSVYRGGDVKDLSQIVTRR
ncbi:Tubulin polymerization-promoting protein member 3 [Gonapodya sp. JEL0774]|nr:Tubulin polymerization-promoting protein member 3 [Gonapodya sp. JEL0774]